VEEKNPTIVNFPLRGLDFKDCERFTGSIPRYERLTGLSDIDAPPSSESTLYDLIANITLESVAGTTRDKENTMWKVHLRAGGSGVDNEKWFMIQDLIVEEVRKEMIFLGETVLQVRRHLHLHSRHQLTLRYHRYGNGVQLKRLLIE
jgi:U4/U6.U5 tri-snRNP-associated protein 2